MKRSYLFSSVLFLFFSTLFSCKLDPKEQEIIKVGGNLSFNGGEILEHNLFQTFNERSATTNGTPIGDITPTYIITAYQGTKIGPSIKTTEQTWELGIQEGYWFFLCQGYQSTSIFDESTLICQGVTESYEITSDFSGTIDIILKPIQKGNGTVLLPITVDELVTKVTAKWIDKTDNTEKIQEMIPSDSTVIFQMCQNPESAENTEVIGGTYEVLFTFLNNDLITLYSCHETINVYDKFQTNIWISSKQVGESDNYHLKTQTNEAGQNETNFLVDKNLIISYAKEVNVSTLQEFQQVITFLTNLPSSPKINFTILLNSDITIPTSSESNLLINKSNLNLTIKSSEYGTKRILFANKDPTNTGTALDISSNTLNLQDVIIQGGYRPDDAGGLKFTGSNLNIKDSIFRVNFGSGIYITETSKAQLTNCLIDDNETNRSNDGGAGLYIKDSTVEIIDCVISNNRAKNSSGYEEPADNSQGGGILIKGSSNVTLKGNTCIGNPSATSHSTNISYSNRANYGAGICITDNSTLNILDNSTISYNWSYQNTFGSAYELTRGGGGIAILSSLSTVNFGSSNNDKVSIKNNGSNTGSGGIYLNSGNLNCYSGDISNNYATKNGGGIGIEDAKGFSLKNITIQGNSANEGSGIYTNTTINLYSNTKIYNNQTHQTGNKNNNVYLYNNKFDVKENPENSLIGVSLYNSPTTTGTVFTNYYYNSDENESTPPNLVFFSDNNNYSVINVLNSGTENQNFAAGLSTSNQNSIQIEKYDSAEISLDKYRIYPSTATTEDWNLSIRARNKGKNIPCNVLKITLFNEDITNNSNYYEFDSENNIIQLKKNLFTNGDILHINLETADSFIKQNASFEVLIADQMENFADNPYFNTNLSKYYINSPQGLKEFANKVNSGNDFSNATIYLENDITVSNWTPIGTLAGKFKGTFDGNGHKITIEDLAPNLDTNEFQYLGLFGYAENATIKNLIVDGHISSIGNIHTQMGGILGYGYKVKIYNCANLMHIRNQVIDSDQLQYPSTAGGIVGRLVSDNNEIIGCYNSGTIDGFSISGGILGRLGATFSESEGSVTLKQCYNIGGLINSRIIISAGNPLYGIGGIVGFYYTSSYDNFADNYNAGFILVNDPTDPYVGNIIGVSVGSALPANKAIWCKGLGKVDTCQGTNTYGAYNSKEELFQALNPDYYDRTNGHLLNGVY